VIPSHGKSGRAGCYATRLLSSAGVMPLGSPVSSDPDEAERMGADASRMKYVAPETNIAPLALPTEPPSPNIPPAPEKAPRVISSIAETAPADEYDPDTGVIWDEPDPAKMPPVPDFLDRRGDGEWSCALK
jgi:hypothetical protein